MLQLIAIDPDPRLDVRTIGRRGNSGIKLDLEFGIETARGRSEVLVSVLVGIFHRHHCQTSFQWVLWVSWPIVPWRCVRHVTSHNFLAR